MPTYAAESKLIGECDCCGFRYPLDKLRKRIVDSKVVALRVCPTCWEPDHPQYGLKHLRNLTDPYPARDPRPGSIGEAPTFFGWNPVTAFEVVGFLGAVTTT